MTGNWTLPLGALVFLALGIYYGGIKGDWGTGGVCLFVAALWALASVSRARSRARSRSRGRPSETGTGHRPGGPPGRR